jgi:RNA polymerase sigma-70 factor (ECF subfamily)
LTVADPTNRDALPDEVLMSRAQADDTEAFAQLYDRHAEQALRIARAICRDRSHAEDAVQEGFLAIWRSRGIYDPEGGSFRAWSMRIVRNRAIDSVRGAAIRPPLQFADENVERPQADLQSASPQTQAFARSDRDELRALLLRLPEEQAEAIVLAFYGELSHSEIAAELGLPPGTVKGRIRLGLQKLRLELAER